MEHADYSKLLGQLDRLEFSAVEAARFRRGGKHIFFSLFFIFFYFSKGAFNRRRTRSSMESICTNQ